MLRFYPETTASLSDDLTIFAGLMRLDSSDMELSALVSSTPGRPPEGRDPNGSSGFPSLRPMH